ncbi:aminoglycoside phosphotransferase family protein [Streptomyces sp. H27-C3]|uniref:aminoglycoside phosphotransferase family protein n=1 Tax=Streptomyces sp. H27-C3 TaxID=3046305 RepID=UPI0024BA250E|nr:aminoglycoside phosphotransferase family protein [Streptomyces sp. H27-C3]MDJ0463979.1 aminoglycoside phosphotransferase family protein [Streptomyces sp. H27-C3]
MDSLVINESLVRTLLHEQHPDVAGLPLRQVPGGWDNQLWRLGDDLAVRLPRTPRAPSLLRQEQKWLPVLAPRLPLPVPTPVRIGEPSAHFPSPWSIATWVPGEPGDRAPMSRAHHAADTLAGFLRSLHHEAPAGAPANPNRGVPLDRLTQEFDRRLRAVTSSGVAADVRGIWDEAVSAPTWEGPPVWLHGDLHPANFVVSAGTLSGVIDFGELCAGDPATDLAAAWLLLPAGAAPRFFDAYEDVRADVDTDVDTDAGHAGSPGPATDQRMNLDAAIRRARGWAALRAVSLIGIGQAWERGLPGGQPTWGLAGRTALARVLAPPHKMVITRRA